MVADLLAELARAFERHRLPYMVAGRVAVLAYGEFRAAPYVDVILGAGPDRVDDALAVAAERGWRVLVSDPAEFVCRTSVPPCQDQGCLRLDLVFSMSPYERQAVERARTIETGAGTVRVASPEDVIVHKLFAGRARDLEDVAGILRRKPELDLGYLRHWLAEFARDRDLDQDMAAQLERLWAEARRNSG